MAKSNTAARPFQGERRAASGMSEVNFAVHTVPLPALTFALSLLRTTLNMIDSTYRTLVAWQRAVDLAVSIYAVTKRFPADERLGLTQQLRRAAVSVPSNIAEGRGRGSRRDYRHFLLQARGSVYELETALHIAGRLAYLPDHDAAALREATAATVRPLNGLIKSLTD